MMTWAMVTMAKMRPDLEIDGGFFLIAMVLDAWIIANLIGVG